MTLSHEVLGMSHESETAILNERLIRIETQLTEIHEIFCKLYLAYEAMSTSPMFAALMGKMGK